jgi:hypothetical protein
MNDQLRTILLAGPQTAKIISGKMGLSLTATNALLRADRETIHCRKNEGQNEFWLPQPNDEFEATEDELAQQATRQEIQEAKTSIKDPPAETPAEPGPNSGTETCPLCQATADQVQAGPEGTYLGAARTCSACKKTYNVFTKEEVKMAKDKTTGTKRAAPLNPQYKINQRIAAAEQAGGKLVYQREGRTWLLTKKGVEPKQMTAQEFSNETVETIHKYLGFTPPPAAPKAEKAAPAKAAQKSGSKGGAKKGGKAKAEKADAELVG